MKIKIEFASWTEKKPLEIEAADIKEAVEKAVKNGVDLSYADLSGVNLSYANLVHVDLSYADLSGVNLSRANLRGANLGQTDLSHVNLHLTNLHGAKCDDKELWKPRPVLQLGCCGSAGRSTLVMFFADKSNPLIRCGCFSGTIEEFEAKIHERHGGTFHEYEYMAMVDHIKAIRKYQLEEGEAEQ